MSQWHDSLCISAYKRNAVFLDVRMVEQMDLQVSQGALSVFGSTMKQSARPLYMLVFFTSIAMIVFSSLIYYAERGIYDEELKMWCVASSP